MPDKHTHPTTLGRLLAQNKPLSWVVKRLRHCLSKTMLCISGWLRKSISAGLKKAQTLLIQDGGVHIRFADAEGRQKAPKLSLQDLRFLCACMLQGLQAPYLLPVAVHLLLQAAVLLTQLLGHIQLAFCCSAQPTFTTATSATQCCGSCMYNNNNN